MRSHRRIFKLTSNVSQEEAGKVQQTLDSRWFLWSSQICRIEPMSAQCWLVRAKPRPMVAMMMLDIFNPCSSVCLLDNFSCFCQVPHLVVTDNQGETERTIQTTHQRHNRHNVVAILFVEALLIEWCFRMLESIIKIYPRQTCFLRAKYPHLSLLIGNSQSCKF